MQLSAIHACFYGNRCNLLGGERGKEQRGLRRLISSLSHQNKFHPDKAGVGADCADTESEADGEINSGGVDGETKGSDPVFISFFKLPLRSARSSVLQVRGE